VTQLYSIKDAARIFGIQDSRLRYWITTGFVSASVKRGGRLYYKFEDLISVKAALELLEAGLSTQRVRKHLAALRAILADDTKPVQSLRFCSDGDTVVAVEEGVAFDPSSGQVVMSFAVDSLRCRVAEVFELRGPPDIQRRDPAPEAIDESDSVPTPIDDDPTIANDGVNQSLSAYERFLEGVAAEEQADEQGAERSYRRAIELEPSLAAAHTNLGNIYFRRGQIDDARAEFEAALEYEPGQPEARYNLANLLDDTGETDHAIAELRRVCRTNPEFADAHYNLGLILARVGGVAQAKTHLEQYLALDPRSEWAERGREFLAAL
jgi:tetratricopeptide (TPR) repeat protein